MAFEVGAFMRKSKVEKTIVSVFSVTGLKRTLMERVVPSCVLILTLFSGMVSAQPEADLAWVELLQGRAVAVIRHAIAPGFGDPAHFRLTDCATQRNLSEEGRVQARRIGSFFRQKGIREASVYSSQWCRCLETARLMQLGDVRPLPVLNSFFQDDTTGDAQTLETRRFIRNLPGGGPAILVTHQVNITALTGIFPSSGEIILLHLAEEGRVIVLERVIP